MHGLISRMPLLTIVMLIGIAGMFLAPFGMLISKWAVLEALAKRNPIFPPIVIFGGSLMLFFCYPTKRLLLLFGSISV